jgi:hypothetical protein
MWHNCIIKRIVVRREQILAEPINFRAARLDPYAARITSGVAYLGGLLMVPLLFAYLSNLRWDGLLIPTALALPIGLFLLLSYAFQPLQYMLDDTHLTIKRRWFRALKIPLEQITAASAAPGLAGIPQRGLRFAFNPGIFGYQGPYRLAPYGEAFMLATNRERLVSLAREGRPPLIISPEQPRAFMTELNERLAGQAATDDRQSDGSRREVSL